MSHPYFFTWQQQRGVKPMRVTGGEGAFFDTDEGRFLDMGSFSYQVNAGHGQQAIVDAIVDQARRQCLTLPVDDYPAKRELAEALLKKAPNGFSKVFFALGGAEANENALKIARLVTGRYKVISRYRSYHGATLGAVSTTGDWRRAPVEPAVPGAIHVMDLDDGVEGTQIPRVLKLEENVGAVILEPVVGANGVLIPPAGYFEEVREACDQHGALLIIDEVFTGFGRTGRYFGYEHFGVVPDMITIGKGLTGGYATLSAVLVHDRIATHFDENVLACGLTHYAHPLGVAAALATMKVYEEQKLVENAAALESPLQERLRALCRENPSVVSAERTIGLLAGVDLMLNEEQLGRLKQALRARRVFSHVYGPRQTRSDAGLLVISPPLCINETELRDGLERIAAALHEATQ